MRCRCSNKKTLKKLSDATGLPVISALVRGNTGHRYDLAVDGISNVDETKPINYNYYSYWPDGTLRFYPDGYFSDDTIDMVVSPLKGKKQAQVYTEEELKTKRENKRLFDEIFEEIEKKRQGREVTWG
jgi:hypothetical protein